MSRPSDQQAHMTSLFPDRRYPYTPRKQVSSVADPKCSSRIPDPKTLTKEKGEKKLIVIPFSDPTNFTKLKIILFLKC
jgi:hypothetical protein